MVQRVAAPRYRGMAILADHYPHLSLSHSSPNQPRNASHPPILWEGRSLSSGEGLGTSLDAAMARRHFGMACHSGGPLPSALAVTLRISSISSRRRFRARITRCVSYQSNPSPMCPSVEWCIQPDTPTTRRLYPTCNREDKNRMGLPTFQASPNASRDQ